MNDFNQEMLKALHNVTSMIANDSIFIFIGLITGTIYYLIQYTLIKHKHRSLTFFLAIIYISTISSFIIGSEFKDVEHINIITAVVGFFSTPMLLSIIANDNESGIKCLILGLIIRNQELYSKLCSVIDDHHSELKDKNKDNTTETKL